ncbi:KR domain-containing protein, partial [Streptomyces sp. T-3]|nr:KR domain-containing protein [Streptomyces sp. T-3]
AVSIGVEDVPAWAEDPLRVALAELALPRPRLAEVRYTATGREVRVLRSTGHRARPHASARLRPGGRYLISDAGSGAGQRLATALALEHGARIVLFGPLGSPVPAGARIVRVPGRLSRYDDARTAVYAALHTFGGLDGIVHCADPAEARPLARQSVITARRTIADAISGATHLDGASSALPLDFFALATDASGYESAVGGSVSAAVGRAFGAIVAARTRLAATPARHGASVTVRWPAPTDGLTALADVIGNHSEALA